ncbi:MAG: beta strand repeat-containing protein [Anaerolineae bacterium]
MKSRFTLAGFVLVLSLILVISVMGLLGLDLPGVRAAGNTIYVSTTGTDTGTCGTSGSPCRTIAMAIFRASDGDIISIAAGTYSENLQVYINLSFVGASAGSTIIDGGGAGRVIGVWAPSAAFSDMTIQNGLNTGTNGGGIYTEGALTLSRVNVLSNTATSSSGGGAFARGTIVVTGSLFSNNRADYGGGLDSWGMIVVTNTDFISNSAVFSGGGAHAGGAMVVVGSHFMSNTATIVNGGGMAADGSAWLTDTAFISNSAYSCGGAEVRGSLWVAGSQFYSNTAQFGGGLCSSTSADVSNSIFETNHARSDGGGFSADGPTKITDSHFTKNTANQGAGVYQYLGSLHISNTHFLTNSASAYGGGVYASRITVVTNTQFISNSAGSGGGGLFADFGSTATISGAQFISNTAGINGGGLWTNEPAWVAHSEFLSNTASNSGGGYMASDLSNISHALFRNNTAGVGGGLYTNEGVMVVSSEFIGNNAISGGGMGAFDPPMISDTLFLQNYAATSGGGLHSNAGVVMTACIISDNEARSDGGGIFAEGVVSLTGTHVLSNTSGGSGGGMYAGGAILVGSEFISNTATGTGGGLYGYTMGITAFDTLFSNNTSHNNGGGLYTEGGVIGSGMQFLTNTGAAGGGLYADSVIVITDSLFSGNLSSANGGGLYGRNRVTITATDFISNTSESAGGGLYAVGVMIVDASQFLSNTAGHDGGGLYVENILTATHSLFSNNSASSFGGGIYSHREAKVAGTVFLSNKATNGGGVFVGKSGEGMSSFINVQFQANSATSEGAALYLFDIGQSPNGNKAIILHTTIASPTVGLQSAIYAGTHLGSPDKLYITNTIIASYTTAIKLDSSVVVTSDYNLFYNAPTSVAIGSHSITGTNPLFVDPVGGDYHLSAASAAIDAGTDAGVVTDLDGNSRPYSLAYDIGAYEAPFKGAKQVFLTKAGTGTGSVTSAPEGLNCGTSCNARFAYLEVVTLTATPVANSTFTGWTVTAAPASPLGMVTPNGVVADCPGTGPCVVTMTENKTITATFTIQTRTLTVGINGTGGGTVTPTGGVYDYGTVVTVTATPYISSTFSGWTVRTLPLGAININGIPSECPGTGACLVTMTENKAVTATFTLKTFTLTPTAGPYGSITPGTAQTVSYGASKTFTITADTGYHITDVGVDGVSQGVIKTYTFSNVTATHVITASFMKSVGPWYVSTVGSDVDDCTSWGTACRTIAHAVTLASDHDVIYIATGVYTENVTVPTIISFIGAGADATIVNGNQAGRVFYVTASSVAFSQMTIENGWIASGDGAGIYADYAVCSVSLSNVNVISNTAVTYNGGGLWALGTVIITDSLFSNNQADYGGGLWAYDTVTMTGTQFISNTASFGAGLFTQGELVVTNSQFLTNSATFEGGGADAHGSVILDNALFNNNTAASNDGGGLFTFGSATMAGTRFINNRAGRYGGGMYARETVVAESVDFISNTAVSYGGGLASHGTVAITDSIFYSNTAVNNDGGGVYADLNATYAGTEFYSNTAGYQGGGFFSNGNATVTDSEFLTNTAQSNGGGLATNGNLVVTNALFGGNSSDGGGGLFVLKYAAITGTSFIGNSARNGGGMFGFGISTVSDTLFLANHASEAGGGLYCNGECTLITSTLSDNSAGYNGGGIFANALVLTGTQLISNTSGDQGGGLYANGRLVITGSEFISNTSANGGGGFFATWEPVTTTSTLFQNNNTGGDGGGLFAWGPVTVIDTYFIANTGNFGGGISSHSAVVVTGSHLFGNHARLHGGGLFTYDTIQVTGTEFTSNTTDYSGGGLSAIKAIMVSSSQFFSNSATSSGGGISANDTAMVSDSLFRSNTANEFGGGVFAGSTATVETTQFVNNSSFDGGGVYVYGEYAGESSFINVLFEANTAQTDGAALYLYHIAGKGGTATILHSTIVSPSLGANSAFYVGKPQGFAVVVGITNSIVASYTTGISVTSGATVTSDYNLFYNAPTSVAIGSHSITSTNPMFVNPGIGDYHLTSASLAIDAGTNAGVTTDLEGNSRPFALGFDIGAYESPYMGTMELFVAKAGTGSGNVTSAPAGLNCGTNCSAHFAYGEVVTLTAAPVANSAFTGWTVTAAPSSSLDEVTPNGVVAACMGTDPCVVVMTEGKIVTATFTIQTRTLTVGMDGTGGGSVTPTGGVYDYGTVVNVTANPYISSTFSGWTERTLPLGAVNINVNPAGCSGLGACLVTMTENKAVTATFTLKTFTLTPDAGPNGSITPSTPQTVNYGANQTFTITANSGYHISDVWVDGSSVGITTTYTFVNVTSTHEISAAFAINTYVITPLAGNNGSITPSTPQTVTHGTSVTFTITANTGYHISDVGVDGESVGIATTYTFVNVTGTHSITAEFAINTYTLTVNKDGTGDGSVAFDPTGGFYNHGTVVTLTATPLISSTFTGWHVASAPVGSIPVDVPNGSCAGTGDCVLLMTGNKAVTATFTLKTYTITPTAGANGSITPDTEQTVDYGANQTFTITADTGYRIADVVVDGSSVGITTSYTFSNITANHTITAAFAIDTFVLTTTVAITNSGSIDVFPKQEIYHDGDVVTLTAVPAFSWFFTGWTGDITGSQNTVTVTFRSDISVVANFGTRYYYLPLTFTLVPTVQALKEP